MKKILLTQGQYTFVDDADYKWLNKHKWCAHGGKYTFYAERRIQIDGKRYILPMHRFILGLLPGDGKQTDHVDRNGLNNQRSNLRICSRAENQYNRRSNQGGSSQYKGVSWNNERGKWKVEIKIAGKSKFVGRFDSEIEAALAYNRAAAELFGEYARLNDVGKNEVYL